jgi:hypothetical protein
MNHFLRRDFCRFPGTLARINSLHIDVGLLQK